MLRPGILLALLGQDFYDQAFSGRVAPKPQLVSLRMTAPEKQELEHAASLCGQLPAPLAAADPEEIEASLQLHAERDFEGMEQVLPTLEKL